jgi:hypothetical protein
MLVVNMYFKYSMFKKHNKQNDSLQPTNSSLIPLVFSCLSVKLQKFY